MTKLSPHLPHQPDNKERAGEKAIALTYLFFFCIWLTGYGLGLSGHPSFFTAPSSFLLGFPLWFVVSCLFAFTAVVCVLFIVSRHFFK